MKCEHKNDLHFRSTSVRQTLHSAESASAAAASAAEAAAAAAATRLPRVACDGLLFTPRMCCAGLADVELREMPEGMDEEGRESYNQIAKRARSEAVNVYTVVSLGMQTYVQAVALAALSAAEKRAENE